MNKNFTYKTHMIYTNHYLDNKMNFVFYIIL